MIYFVSYHNIVPTKREKDFLLDVMQEFDRYFNKIVSIDWKISSERELKIAYCKIHSKSGYFRAKTKSKNLRMSINDVVEKLKKQKRRKKKMQNRAFSRINGVSKKLN